MFIRGSGFVKRAYLMQTHKKKYPAKDLKAIERKTFSLLTQAASNKQKDTVYTKYMIYFGASLFTTSLTAYKVLISREISLRYILPF